MTLREFFDFRFRSFKSKWLLPAKWCCLGPRRALWAKVLVREILGALFGLDVWLFGFHLMVFNRGIMVTIIGKDGWSLYPGNSRGIYRYRIFGRTVEIVMCGFK